MKWIVLLAALAGCNISNGNNCPAATPLPCAGTGLCCPAEEPIHCGSQCFNSMPTAAECGDAITVCSDSSSGTPCESGSYCYEWACFGDPECVSTNPNGTVTGANDEGNDVSCAGLITFGQHFWNIPPAYQSCTLIP
jgi:hypothetical protein